MSVANFETIAALATPPGVGALALIRLSGPEAIPIANRLFPRKDLKRVPPHTVHYGTLVYQDEILDEVLLSVFHGPHSFTGEDVVEISMHGSTYIVQSVLQAVYESGARPANPGEFTMRAFMNGRMDLTQAEAVTDLIQAESQAAHRVAMFGMRGGFSKRIKELRERLLNLASLLELELDFAEEDVEFADRKQLKGLLHEIGGEIRKLAESFRLGNVMKEGVKVVIAGRPNAGKSTLLNALLEEERAIVSDIPGTTRDTIEDVVTIEGFRFRFVDTAGIRATEDHIESLGISRTWAKLNEADVVLYIYDVSLLSEAELREDLATLPAEKPVLIVANKVDRLEGAVPEYENLRILLVSAKDGNGLEELKQALIEIMNLEGAGEGEVVVTNARHYFILHKILEALGEVESGMAVGLSSDLLAIDIRKALHYLGEITGEVTTDEILGNIFSRFCIGK